MALEETRIEQLENITNDEELEQKRKELAELEDRVRREYLAEHKDLPVEELLGIISKKVTYKGAEYHIITTISKEDYKRITSDSESSENLQP